MKSIIETERSSNHLYLDSSNNFSTTHSDPCWTICLTDKSIEKFKHIKGKNKQRRHNCYSVLIIPERWHQFLQRWVDKLVSFDHQCEGPERYRLVWKAFLQLKAPPFLLFRGKRMWWSAQKRLEIKPRRRFWHCVPQFQVGSLGFYHKLEIEDQGERKEKRHVTDGRDGGATWMLALATEGSRRRALVLRRRQAFSVRRSEFQRDWVGGCRLRGGKGRSPNEKPIFF